jgi:hypothetical protein
LNVAKQKAKKLHHVLESMSSRSCLLKYNGVLI